MTKEYLYNGVRHRVFEREIYLLLDLFFESNICIPKGENRHEFADVWHEWIEGTNIEWFDPFSQEWVKQNNILNISCNVKYRIKPQEPIYEWEYVMHDGINEFARTKYMTDEEFQNSPLQYDYWSKDESTKRERK